MGYRRITITLSLTAEELVAIEEALEEREDLPCGMTEAESSALDKVRHAAKKLKNINGNN